MEATRIGADELTRLQAVQARVRTLARNHGWFGDAIRAAFVGYLALGEHHQREKSAMHDRERRLARDLLAKGRLFDPGARGNSPCLFVRVEGLCPVALAERLGEHGRDDAMPRKLELEGAAAALAALDRDAIYQARDLPENKREAMAVEYRAALAAKTHVSFSWTIVVSRPADWQEPPDPRSLDRADLERFAEADYRTIALHRLGGLADVGALRPIVPKPNDTGDMVRDVGAYAAWRFRFPIDDDHRDQNQPPLSVRALPPDVAEQLLDDVETWAKGEAATLGESLNASGPSVSPDLLDRLQRAAAAVDPGAIDRVAERAAEKVAHVFGGGNGAVGGPARTEVVLWEGAEHNERNVRLARTRSAYLEAHGKVAKALAALEAGGNAIGKSTIYDHLNALDDLRPGWRAHVLVPGASGNPENGVTVRTREKTRGGVR
jgi:hypothetical protein